MNTTWEFSGREYYFDVSEYECIKKMGKALSALGSAAEESIKKTLQDCFEKNGTACDKNKFPGRGDCSRCCEV